MSRTTLRLKILAFSGLLATAGLNVATAAPAAAIPGLGNISVATAVNSNVFKSAVATCPAGQRVIGGGARLTISTGEVSITRMAPTAATDGYEAGAYEDVDGFAGAWGLVVTAICANPPPGYTVVTAMSPMGSPATASATATCPGTLQVLGTGGAETPGFAGSWNVQSWAICAAPVAGHTVVVTVGVATSASPKTLTSTCPAGRPVHGVGFLTVGAGVGERSSSTPPTPTRHSPSAPASRSPPQKTRAASPATGPSAPSPSAPPDGRGRPDRIAVTPTAGTRGQYRAFP